MNKFVAKVTKEIYGVAMADNKVKNLHMQIKGEFGKRLEALAKKNGIANPAVIRQLVFKEYDREIGEKKRNGS